MNTVIHIEKDCSIDVIDFKGKEWNAISLGKGSRLTLDSSYIRIEMDLQKKDVKENSIEQENWKEKYEKLTTRLIELMHVKASVYSVDILEAIAEIPAPLQPEVAEISCKNCYLYHENTTADLACKDSGNRNHQPCFGWKLKAEVAEKPDCRTCVTSSTNTGKFCDDMNCINHNHWVKYVPPEKQTAKQ